MRIPFTIENIHNTEYAMRSGILILFGIFFVLNKKRKSIIGKKHSHKKNMPIHHRILCFDFELSIFPLSINLLHNSRAPRRS